MKTQTDFDPADPPPGLDREILRILQARVGRDQALPRARLLVLVHNMPNCRTVSDRQLRAAINQLRKDGNLICSAGGEEGGYYSPASWDELDDYLQRELHSRAMDMLEQEKALKRAAERRWGPQQFSLFGG